MADSVRKVDYYYTTVDDKSGVGTQWLEWLQQNNVNLLAFTVFPVGGGKTQFDFVPENAAKLAKTAADAERDLVGPKTAFLLQGKDQVGVLVDAHRKMSAAGLNVHAATAVSDSKGGYGYLFWVKESELEKAANALGV